MDNDSSSSLPATENPIITTNDVTTGEALMVETVESEATAATTNDPLEQKVTCVLQTALMFFAVLLAGTILVIVFALSSQFSFIILSIVFVLLVLLFMGCTLGNLQPNSNSVDDSNLLQRQHRQWQQMVTQVFVDEVRNFQQDYQEHMLFLTYDDTDVERSTNEVVNDNDEPFQNNNEKSKNRKKKKKGGKSVVFQVVKPFLKLRRKRKNQAAHQHDEYYVPPPSPRRVV
mmetsp:Transcript_18321/g.27685  ORF Transcript_18321/g.27685 Transcript_18321/m.27685 type:complete len:230 (+) Transcript_18321:22-711(+)